MLTCFLHKWQMLLRNMLRKDANCREKTQKRKMTDKIKKNKAAKVAEESLKGLAKK